MEGGRIWRWGGVGVEMFFAGWEGWDGMEGGRVDLGRVEWGVEGYELDALRPLARCERRWW